MRRASAPAALRALARPGPGFLAAALLAAGLALTVPTQAAAGFAPTVPSQATAGLAPTVPAQATAQEGPGEPVAEVEPPESGPEAGPNSGPDPAAAREATAHADTARADTARRWSLALRGGFASPKGDLADLADDGQFLGLELGYRDRGLPRLRLLFEFNLENMERGGGGQVLRAPLGPDIELWRLMGGVSADLLEPGLTPWEISAQGMFGVTIISSSDFVAADGFVDSQPTFATGLTVGRRIGSRFTAFARADFYIWLGDTRHPEPNFFGKEVVLTHTFGVRWRF